MICEMAFPSWQVKQHAHTRTYASQNQEIENCVLHPLSSDDFLELSWLLFCREV